MATIHCWLRLIVAACCACLAPFVGAAPSPVVSIDQAAGYIPVWPGLRVAVETDGPWSPERAAEHFATGRAQAVDSPERNFGRATTPIWAGASLHNPDAFPQLRLLTMEGTTQYDTRLYLKDQDGAWRRMPLLAEMGGGRFGSGTPFPVWQLDLPPERTVDVLIRMEGPAIVRYPVFAYRPALFAERSRNTHLLMGVTLGVCLLIGIYIGSLRRFHDDGSVPLFICMLVADMVAALWLSGFLCELWPAVPESMLSPIGFAAYAVLFGCGCLHAGIYLNVKAWAPKLTRGLQLLGALWLVLAPWFGLLFPVAARVALVAGGALTAAVVVAACILAIRRRVPFSLFIAAAWLAYLGVSFSFFIARAIDNPLLWSPNTLALTQAAVTAILFGLAMSQRLMRQRDALAAARREEAVQREKDAALMRERSLFFAATAHDLRQPLVGIGLFANLLRSAPSAAEREAHGQKLEQALAEVNELLVGIQQLAAINEAAHRPRLETVALDDLLRPVIEEYRGQSERKRVTLRYVPSRLSIVTHVPYFLRIVRNILSNAIRYTNHGDRVLVGCRRGGGLRLVFADTGRGMSEEQVRLAFEAFQRFDTELSVPDGFGLGLFSAKSLARALGMDIRLHSRKGYGAEFAVTGIRIGEPVPHRRAQAVIGEAMQAGV